MMDRIRALGVKLGASFAILCSELTDWLPLTLLIGFAPGIALAVVLEGSVGFGPDKTRPDTLVTLYDLDARISTLWMGLGSLGLWIACCAFVVVRARRRVDCPSLRTLFVELNHRWLPLATLPLGTYFLCNRTKPRFDSLDLILAATFAGSIGYYCYQSALSKRWACLRRLTPISRGLSVVTLLLLWLAYSSWASYVSIVEHWNMGSRIYDLGVYNNTVFNTSQGRWLNCAFTLKGTHVSSHFDPVLILISPLYWLYPRAETLLILQSVWLGAGVFPIYLYSRFKQCTRGEALLFVSAYLLMPALHGINFFDFHSLALMVPLVAWVLYFLETCRWRLYAATVTLLLLVREDQAIIVSTIGLYALLTRRSKVGSWTLIAAIAYAMVTHFVTAAILGPGGARAYDYYYGEVMAAGKTGAKGLVYSVLSNPLLALATLLKLPKLYYFLKLFLPLGFLPLLGGKKRWLLVYGIAFIGLSSRWAVPTVHYQYSAIILPFAMLAAIDGLCLLFASKSLERLAIPKQPLRVACFGAVAVASLATSLAFGAWPSNPGFYSGRGVLQRHYDKKQIRRHRQLSELLAQIPPDSSVCADATMGPHVSSRELVFTWPNCKTADFILLYKGKMNKREQSALSKLPKIGEKLFDDQDFSFYRAHSEDSPTNEDALDNSQEELPEPTP